MGQEINFRRQRGGKKRKVKKKKNHLKFEDNKKKLKFEKKKNPRLIRQIIIWAAEIAELEGVSQAAVSKSIRAFKEVMAKLYNYDLE